MSAKSEAFSLGMTLLEVALLESSEDLYGVKPRSLDTKALEKKLKTVAEEYPQFRHYLGLLLNTNEGQRYSAGEVWSILRVYSEKIL